ncbi:MAG: histone deacetylase family protein, partial [Thalassobaculaceae bacterium]
DVHHGNGTQHAFEQDGDFFFASSHQFPFYPGTGDAREVGRGNVHNAPLPAAAGSEAFRAAWQSQLLPALAAFKPDLIIISAGFDAHRDDPLAEIQLDDDDYVWITREIMAIAADSAGGRLISSLEGGYDLAALGRSVAAHVTTLMANPSGAGSQAGDPALT